MTSASRRDPKTCDVSDQKPHPQLLLRRNRPRSAPGSPAVVDNIDLMAEDSPVKERWLNHLNFTDSPAIQALVMERILEAGRRTRKDLPAAS